MKNRIIAALVAASAALGLSGCTTDGYGYGGVSMGYGSPYYGDPYWGWYDDYYYPGTGYYIYDRRGTRHRWNDRQRAYWEGRRGHRSGRSNWSGYRRDRNDGDARAWQQRREAWRARRDSGQQQGLTDQARQQRREAWRAQRQQQGASDASRQQRREAWRAQRQQSGSRAGEMWRGRGGEGRRKRDN